MAEIKVTPSELRLSSQAISTIEKNFMAMVGELKTDMLTMKSTWEGQAAESFLQQFNTLDRNFQEYSTVIKSYAEFLSKAAVDFEVTEDRIKANTNTLR